MAQDENCCHPIKEAAIGPENRRSHLCQVTDLLQSIGWGLSYEFLTSGNTLKLAQLDKTVFVCNLCQKEDVCGFRWKCKATTTKTDEGGERKSECKQSNNSISSFLSHGKPDDDDLNMYFYHFSFFHDTKKKYDKNGTKFCFSSMIKLCNFSVLCADFFFLV
jgi:hypothetical protein